MKPGIYNKAKDFIISEEDLNKLTNNEIITNFKTLSIAENDDIEFFFIYYVSQVECYALLIVNKCDSQNYEITPIGIECNFDLMTGKHLAQLFREDFEDDIVIGINENNNIEMFEWDFVPEFDSDMETLNESFLEDTYIDFKSIYDEMKEIEIWNEGFKVFDDETI